MNRPDKAGEPSMEEILASIRQIIADDPPSDRSPIAVEPNPLVPQSASGARKSEASEAKPGPLVDRLSNVLKSGPLPPTSPLGSKRPLSFDQDLADMFDDTADGGAVPTPKPDLRVPLELSSSVSKPVAPPVAEERPAASLPPAMAAPVANGAATPSPPVEPPLPFGSAGPRPAEPAAAPPPRSFGFPPLRKQGFYPPQPKTPELPPLPSAVPEAAAAATPTPAVTDEAESGLDKALERLSGLGAVVPAAVAPSAPIPDPFASKVPSDGRAAPVSSGLKIPDLSVAPELPPVPGISSSEPASPTLAPPAASLPASDPAAGLTAPFAAAPAQPGKIALDTPAFASGARPAASALNGAFASGSEATASQALDALAQGLAASAASVVSASGPSQPAIPLTPVVEPAEPRAAAASPSLPATTAQPAAAGRTLEDAVADMLRPMLQQWVAENMPRIIEKALRSEVARSTKPGSSSSS